MPPVPKKKLTSSPALFNLYKQRREISSELINNGLFNCLPKKALKECGKRLGIHCKGKTFYFEVENEFDILCDYTLYYYHSASGKNAIDRYIDSHYETLSDEEKSVVLSKKQSEYGIFIIKKLLPHGGIIVVNLMNEKEDLMIDKGLSVSGSPGMVLASNTLRFPEFIMMTGVGIPINNIFDRIVPLLELQEEYSKDFESLPRVQQVPFITQVLKVCLRENASENIKYKSLE